MVQKNINIKNKKARFEFEILDKYVAGIQLTGTEIKSIRLSQARIMNVENYLLLTCIFKNTCLGINLIINLKVSADY